MDAVVLAGGRVPKELAQEGYQERALIEVQGVSILHRVLSTLTANPAISRVIVVTTPTALAGLDTSTVVAVPSGDSLLSNLLAGAQESTSEQILIVTGDVPLVTSATWTTFLQETAARGLQAAYPIVRQEDCLRQFPEGKRTFARLKDGTFTGGNAFVVPAAALGRLSNLIEAAYSARKNPLALARLLGPMFIVRGVAGLLTVPEVENRLSALLQCKGGAVVMDDASIAFDVDKLSDLHVASRALGQPVIGAAHQPSTLS